MALKVFRARLLDASTLKNSAKVTIYRASPTLGRLWQEWDWLGGRTSCPN